MKVMGTSDVNYTFKQVDIVIPRVDGSANCGSSIL